MMKVSGTEKRIAKDLARTPFKNQGIQRLHLDLRDIGHRSSCIVSNQQKWDTLRPEKSVVVLRSCKLPESPIVLSSPLDCLGLHLLPAS